jgi:hypothetical protein
MALPWGGVLQVGDSAGWSDASGFENLVSDALKVGADEIELAVKCHGHGLQLLQVPHLINPGDLYPLTYPATDHEVKGRCLRVGKFFESLSGNHSPVGDDDHPAYAKPLSEDGNDLHEDFHIGGVERNRRPTAKEAIPSGSLCRSHRCSNTSEGPQLLL